jgi:hypothetical protein
MIWQRFTQQQIVLLCLVQAIVADDQSRRPARRGDALQHLFTGAGSHGATLKVSRSF